MGRFFAVVIFLLVSPAASYCQSYLVLPFFNVTKSADLNWASESLSESLSGAFAAEGMLTIARADREEVLRRLAIKPYALLTRASVIKIAISLDASSVVYGQLESVNEGIRVTAFALDIRKLASLGEFSETGSVADLGSIETRLAWRILKTLNPQFTISQQEYIQQHPPVRSDALENYVRGLLAKNDEQRLQSFTQASRLDGRFAAPAFELGKLYFRKKQWQEASLWLSRLDGRATHFREATFYLGIARYQMGDYEAAERSFALVAEAVPLNEVLNNLAAAQSRLGRGTALDNFKKALEGAEADPGYQFNVGYALMKRGDYSAAAERFRAVLDRSPNDSQAMQLLGSCLKGPSASDVPVGAERLKTSYQEAVFLQLKAVLQPSKSR